MTRTGWQRTLKGAGCAAAVAAATLFGGSFSPVHAVNPIMHNASSVGSTYWGGSWGNSPGSKYGQFTCSTCHTMKLQRPGFAKNIRTSIQAPNSPTDSFPGSTVVFGSYTSYGKDTGHTTSTSICEVCHTQTSHHRYNNAGYAGHNGSVDCNNNGQCHVHSNGFAKPGGGESSGGSACGGCHGAGANAPALFSGISTNYSMHNKISKLAYRHFMSTDATTNTGGNTAAVGTLGKSTYYNDVPNALTTNLAARRCLMCHVDHDQFKPGLNTGNFRAQNLRQSATATPTAGTRMSEDSNLCLSCHNTARTKAYVAPDGQSVTPAIPFKGATYANATTLINASPHGYAVKSAYFRDGSQFNGVCVKCHNDSIGGNGFDPQFGNMPKSSMNGQYSTAGRLPRYGSHASTIQAKFAVLGNDFWTGVAASGTVTSLTVTGNPWAATVWEGYTLTLTKGTGSGGTSPASFSVYSSSTNTLYLKSGNSFSAAPDGTTLFEISNSAPTVDNICFSCHSKGTSYKPFANYSTTDWYGQQYMGSRIAGMQNVFDGDSGTMTTSVSRKNTVTVTVQHTWAANALNGYFFKAPGGTRKITASTAVTGPGSTQLTLDSVLTSGAGPFMILKPASHPLDTYGRHDSAERDTVAALWNKGDTGTVTTAGSTSITDSNKSWQGSEFNGLKITFPGQVDSSGNVASSTISGGTGAGVVNFSAIAGYTPAVGDNYYIGNRHVSCTDCHNTHASVFTPEGNVTSASNTDSPDLYTLTAADAVNVKGWTNGQWNGYLIRVRSSAGFEQVRYIKNFTAATGKFVVSLPWSTIPTSSYSYEVLTGDQWSATSQSGGRAGGGSGGQWGVQIPSFRAPTLGNMTTGTAYNKIENVYDVTGSNGGSSTAGQRDLCVKCHSSYAYGGTTPNTPSGNADGTKVRSTDVTKEFNPNNQAHHAIYARGKNQPIRANYGNLNTGVTSTLSPNWPLATGTLSSIATGGPDSLPGYVTLATGSLPATALPGWFMYIGSSAPTTKTPQTPTSTTGWVEITKIVDATHFYVRRENAVGTWPNVTYDSNITNAGTQAVAITAGLGNAFVPPYGPWSILRCTDCHGSTKTDPVGPHASVNKWLIKDADASLSFPWFNAGTVTTITPNTTIYSTAYFCFNCHRRDVYCDPNQQNPTSATLNLGRQTHGVTGLDTNGSTMTVTYTKWPQHCRMCHGGDKLGGIHGTNAVNGNTATGSTSNQQGKRFLNGSAWGTFAAGGGGVKRGTTTTAGGCYTANKVNTTVDNCGKSHANQSYGSVAIYDYDTP